MLKNQSDTELVHELKKIMHTNRWSQRDLAEDTNFSHAHVNCILNMKKPLSKRSKEFIIYYLMEKGVLNE